MSTVRTSVGMGDSWEYSLGQRVREGQVGCMVRRIGYVERSARLRRLMRLIWLLAWLPVFMTYLIVSALIGMIGYCIMGGAAYDDGTVALVCIWLPVLGALTASIITMVIVAWYEPRRNIQTMIDESYPYVVHDSVMNDLLYDVCVSAGLKHMPCLRLSAERFPNAYTMGRSGEPTIIITRGLLDTLGRNSIRAVLAHEVGHIINADYSDMNNLYMVQGFIKRMQRRLLTMFNPLLNSPMNGGSWFGFIISLMLTIPIGIITISTKPLAWFTRRCMSHERENLADANAIRITRDPDSLARALTEIRYGITMSGVSMERLERELHTPMGRYISTISFTTPFDGTDTHPSFNTRINNIIGMGAHEEWKQYLEP